MISWTDMTGLASAALLVASAVGSLAMRLSLSQRRFAVGIAIAVSLLPAGSLSLAGLVRGITGDLSMTAVLLLVLTLFNRLAISSFTYAADNKTRSYAVWAATALLLYPCALGISYVDPYRWGFGNAYFLAVLACVVALALRMQMGLVVWSVLLAVGAWTVGWYESTNLWDYLIDPWLSLYVTAALIVRTTKLLRAAIDPAR